LTFIEVLQDKRRQVVADIERLRTESVSIAAALGTKESQLRNIDDLLAIEHTGAGSTPTPTKGPVVPARSSRFVDAAYELLERDHEPMHYRALAQVLGDGGVYVPGQDPAANLLAHMSRDPRFGRAGRRGMYGLAEWPEVKAAATDRRPRAPRQTLHPRRRTAAPRA
jgi:hypothetical protein